jgi:hypothetical protein
VSIKIRNSKMQVRGAFNFGLKVVTLGCRAMLMPLIMLTKFWSIGMLISRRWQ